MATGNVFEDHGLPSIDAQKEFWARWNEKWRFRDGLDDFMQRQSHIAVAWAARVGLERASILDAGCGTGWLGDTLRPFGRVIGVDLSPTAIAEGSRRHTGVDLRCGDFLTMELPTQFDFVVSADSLAHVADQRAYITRVAGLMRPGGTLLLMSQNPPIWRRRSKWVPTEAGQIEVWPSLRDLRSYLRPSFTVLHVTSLVPGGDRGALWWVENRFVRQAVRQLVGASRWDALLERALLGRELVVVAQRNGSSHAASPS